MSAVREVKVATEIPGPKSKAEAEKLGAFFDNRAFYFIADYDKSFGN
jgi:4-aminobutyrate aminotransferase/(S)-3-amino-2-methylpropionate transaminase